MFCFSRRAWPTACALATFICAYSAAQEPEALINPAATPAQIQAVALTSHGPSLVAYCQCGGLISSTGNLYFTNFGITSSAQQRVLSSNGKIQRSRYRNNPVP